MKIEFREAKSIMSKSALPGVDYVVNPYVGCQHGCIYCYAEFMKRFTQHKEEQWGKFLDIKQFDWDKINPHKFDEKTILFSSVTDPYIPYEKKCKNTRHILTHLLGTTAKISMLTKSSLIRRDFDILKQFKNIEIGISISSVDEYTTRVLEPIASHPLNRLQVIKDSKQEGFKTYIFISPFFPYITDYKSIINRSREYTDYYKFENFNFRPHNVSRIFQFIKRNYPQFFSYYQELKKNPKMWDIIETDIRKYCDQEKLKYKIQFHHTGFSKKEKT